jgi:ribosomal protein L3 glutamine methyltransferase
MKSHADDLISIRDMLRFAVSRFAEAGLAFGQGTSGAVDEAAFLILETLHLPVDDINPWADARLTKPEREIVLGRIEERVVRRVPAAYLTKKAYIQGVPFHVDERVIVPRSFIGELLFSDLFGGEGFALVSDPSAIGRVLDLCTGSGCLAILAARIFPNAQVDAVELSPKAMEVARLNIDESGYGERLHLFQGDLFQPVAKERYDLILTNPPYVDAVAMEELPPEFRHEPAMALDGGEDGLDIVRRILAEVPRHLNPGGGLLCEIGRGRDILEDDYPELDFFWLDTEDSEGEVFWLTAEKFGR